MPVILLSELVYSVEASDDLDLMARPFCPAVRWKTLQSNIFMIKPDLITLQPRREAFCSATLNTSTSNRLWHACVYNLCMLVCVFMSCYQRLHRTFKSFTLQQQCLTLGFTKEEDEPLVPASDLLHLGHSVPPPVRHVRQDKEPGLGIKYLAARQDSPSSSHLNKP